MNTPQIEKLKVFALGGIGEIGKNMYVLEADDSIYIMDTGVMIPEDGMFGIDMVIPDVTYLSDNKEKIKGIFLTHGHEEHMGGLAYILRKLKAPVYGTRLTLALAKELVNGLGSSGHVEFKEIDENTILELDHATVTFFRTNHSIPDSVGLCFHTSQGAIVHTGDFKFDQSQLSQNSDLGKIAEIGNKGVLCVLSDSTNAEKPGYTISESVVRQEIADVTYNAKGRVFAACLSTNVGRIQQIVQATIDSNRKLVVVSHPTDRNFSIATELEYLHIPDDLLIPVNELGSINDDKVVVLTIGTHSQLMSSLLKMARGTHKHAQIKPQDIVMIAASPSPGTELTVAKVIDKLYRAGAVVIYGQKKIHSSGHGCQEELKLMMNLLKPQYVIPIQGEFKMQRALSRVAESVGIDKDNIFLLNKGEVIEFTKGVGKYAGKVYAGNVLIDGLGVGDIGNIVLRDRRLLSQDGIMVVVVSISKSQKRIVAGPEILSRGFVYVRESEELLDKANSIVTDILDNAVKEQILEWSSLKLKIRESLNQHLYEKTRRRPMILPIIMEV
ncbi:ribonuclease J [Sutcliffiella horikoshii]|uniref:ribonuclease J n=1 Tax=Sutcliffiella horikoshii TaxID=79883 RepID=UPI001F37F1E6|nr:ribonuclease J [Sutcliffiella horikoshii]